MRLDEDRCAVVAVEFDRAKHLECHRSISCPALFVISILLHGLTRLLSEVLL